MDRIKKLLFIIVIAQPLFVGIVFGQPAAPAIPGVPSQTTPFGNQQNYGGPGQGSQVGIDPTDLIREGADRRGFHENFGIKTLDNLGKITPPPGTVDPHYPLYDSITKGAEVLTEVAIGLATAFLIWGAIRFAMASGVEEQINHAKAIIKWSIAGLILSLIALSIITMVTNAVQSA